MEFLYPKENPCGEVASNDAESELFTGIGKGLESSILITETFKRSQEFFNLTLAEKNKLAWSDEFSNRGYVGVGRERLDDSKPGDLKEAFNIGKEIDPTCLNTTQPSLSCNRWLGEDESFRDTMLNFFSACNNVAMNLCEAMAIAGLKTKIIATRARAF